MKTKMKYLFNYLLVTTLFTGMIYAQEKISVIIPADEVEQVDAFTIKNINGEVKVTGYDGDEILIEGIRDVWKDRGRISDEDMEKVKLLTKVYEGTVYAYIESPEHKAEFYDGRMEYEWNNTRRNRRDQIRFTYDLEIKVPSNMMIHASTINGGEVRIENMLNGVLASNVNGNILLKDVSGDTDANTVNGNIEVWFLNSPTSDSDFKTVNGTIEVYSPKDLSAVVTFESLHGELYTDFEQVTRLPNRLNKEEDGNGYRYRIEKNSPIQIGEGQYGMSFEMVNGSAFIRERK